MPTGRRDKLLKKTKQAHRKGRPLVVYFEEEQADRLKALAEERHIPKSNIIRFAVDRLFDELNGGQLVLPLGLSD